MRMIFLILVLSASLQGCFPVIAAGAGTGVLIAQDRRTSGAYVEDEAIEVKAFDRISKQFGDKVHVNVTSYNRHVLLTGEVPDSDTKAQVERIVANILNVDKVYNELGIQPNSSLVARSNDTLITSNVKFRFLDDKRFNAINVKVVTERNVVYLMGIVSHAEGQAAAEVASGSKGVSSVVTLFEYVD
jgi:osmotically-inducible protein OsmY